MSTGRILLWVVLGLVLGWFTTLVLPVPGTSDDRSLCPANAQAFGQGDYDPETGYASYRCVPMDNLPLTMDGTTWEETP